MQPYLEEKSKELIIVYQRNMRVENVPSENTITSTDETKIHRSR